MTVKFTALRDSYPTEDRDAFFTDVLQGSWSKLKDEENYKNTCALRMSVALNRTGVAIPDAVWSSDGKFSAGDGSRLLAKVLSMLKLLDATFGDPWGMSKKAGVPFDLAKNVPKWTGVLAYRFPEKLAQARGHVDLWDGTSCHFDCPAPDTDAAFDIALWRLP